MYTGGARVGGVGKFSFLFFFFFFLSKALTLCCLFVLSPFCLSIGK